MNYESRAMVPIGGQAVLEISDEREARMPCSPEEHSTACSGIELGCPSEISHPNSLSSPPSSAVHASPSYPPGTPRQMPASHSSRAGSGPARGRGRPTPQGPFSCDECGKSFERKEYRDKHYRRCIKAANEPRQTRQRSCVSCVASKLGCDQRFPACSRCVLRGKKCRYLTGPKANGRTEHHQDAANLSAPEELVDPEPTFLGYDTVDPGHSHLSAETHLDDQVMNNGTALQRNGSQLETTPSGNPPWPLDSTINGVHPSPDRSMKDVNMMSDWLRQSPSQAFIAPSDADASRWPAYRWPSRSPSVAMGDATAMPQDWDDMMQMGSMMGVNTDMNFDLLGSLGVLPPRSRGTPGAASIQRASPSIIHPNQTGQSRTSMTPSRRNTETIIQTQPPPQNSIPAISAPTTEATLRDFALPQQPTPKPSPENSSPTGANCPFHKLTSDIDTVDIICSYPRLMLRPGIYPPFVHHKIYPCAEGEILEPLAKAFCCVGAFYASVRTSESFAYSLMNTESRRLVNGFQLWSTSDHSMLAAVHAMCIYQIVGFFISTNAEQTRLAEMQQLFFLKMVRKLISTHLQPSRNTNGTDEAESTNWRKWIMNETIRRTVFLANIINTLSCRTQKQNPYYYEALDDEAVLNMALPAPLPLWKASCSEEWLAAKGNLGPEDRAQSQATVKMVLDQVTGQSDIVTPRGRRGGRTPERIRFEELDEFTKIVVSTARAY
ncbi:hypothetical protein BJX76DRAFT_357632 [Aspergillus varians]